MNTFKKTGGFTLVELIIVIAILAILSSVAVAGYSSYIKKANNSAVETWLSNISAAATLANAEAGGISGIDVSVSDDTTKGDLKVVITAKDTFDTDANDGFAYYFGQSITGVASATLDTNATPDTYTFYIDAPSAWANSDYATAGATWDGNWE